MLGRTTCSSHGHPRSLAHGLLARSLRQYAIRANRPVSSRLLERSFQVSKRNVSTQRNGTNETQKVDKARKAIEESLKPQSGNTEQHATTGVKDDGNPAFTLTPKFHWSWRWTYPKPEREALTPGNEKEAGESDSKGFLPLRDKKSQDSMQSIIGSIDGLIEGTHVPLSPLEKEAEGKEWVPKRRPTEQEKTRLSYNPWATMLAGKMRLDPVSKTRLPEPLLLALGQVSSPDGESVYMLPDDLANLEAYDKRLQKALRRLAMQGLPRERGGDQLQILPSKLLVEELTEELVVWDNKANRGRTKHGGIAKRLLPARWLERTQRIDTYQNASKDYWKVKEKEDGPNDPLFEKPEKPTDLLALQWQPNIAERMLSIMRQRLILSIEHLGRKTDQPRDKVWNHFSCFEWPSSGFLDVINGSNKKSGILPSVYDNPEHAGSLSGELEEYRRTRAKPTTSEENNATRQGLALELLTYRLNDPDFWLPGSYFLHIGPRETTQTAIPSSQEHETSSEGQPPARTSISKLNPPMITVNKNMRLPIFNLSALLGSEFNHPLRQILARHDMLPSKNNVDSSSNTQNYLIHIRATAPGSHFILKELWQLWRYVGGTDCLQPPDPMQLLEEEAKSDVRKQKDQIKQYSMSEKVWDNFYAFLPGVERKSGGR